MPVLIGLTLFTGQFLLLFYAYTRGLPPGLASVTQQTQAVFTVLLAAIFLGEAPSPRQWAGIAVAFAGLALIHASWLSIGAALYLGLVATTVAYAVWGGLLQRYPAAVVTPFALLAPCTGVVAPALMFGEMFGPVRYAGMILILAGLIIVVRAPAMRVAGAAPASRPT